MNTRTLIMLATCFALAICAAAQTVPAIQLPPPVKEGGKPLMQVLKERKSARALSLEKLPLPVLSNLLWAAWGINRPESGRRTAPSAGNWQEVDLYVVLEEAAYLYDAKSHSLMPVVVGDHRAAAGKQDFVKNAPLNLVYVADVSRMEGASGDEITFYSAADVGFIAENVYLFCTSEGLSTVVRGNVDREELSKILGLRAEQRVILAQTVGYPKK
jgi:SagB-type dehydrogenase family enzyme